ncbi:MAG: sugar ABC transporter ATP-binding protein, partial [Actinobacteria bacterium]|nr:sugar ABC transporter ATP-binding protein [Actinomycetota bacterium]
ISMGMKQLIEIMRVLSLDLKILCFDEPTSSLSEEETEALFKIIKDLSKKGISIVYVSHKLKEIFQICDRVTVLKDGKRVDTVDIKETSYDQVIRMMVGRNIELFSRKTNQPNNIQKDIVMEVKGLNTSLLKNISFNLKKGEILGMFGIVGSGRTEVARAIFGIDKKISGEIIINGRNLNIVSPQSAVKEGLGFVTEDRHEEGLVLISTVRNNITMPFIKNLSKLGIVQHAKEKNIAMHYIEALDIKTPSDLTLIENLSGGNQQKVVISKWLGAESKILIFDEPTRGIDVAAKSEVYNIILKLAQQGRSVILISSELPEILALSDRLLVFKEGEIKAELQNDIELKEETIIDYAVL